MSEEQTNGIDSTSAKRFVGEILSAWKRTREIREDAKDKIRPELEDLVEHRTGLYKAAESAGLPVEALKLEVKRQKLDWENEIRKKAAEQAAGDDTLELADMIKEVLGDFASSPLGSAAVKAASGDDEPDLRGKAQKDREAQRQADAEQNLSGMKASSAKKDKAKRGRKPKGGAPLVGGDDGAAPKTGADHEAAGLH